MVGSRCFLPEANYRFKIELHCNRIYKTPLPTSLSTVHTTELRLLQPRNHRTDKGTYTNQRSSGRLQLHTPNPFIHVPRLTTNRRNEQLHSTQFNTTPYGSKSVACIIVPHRCRTPCDMVKVISFNKKWCPHVQ